MSTHTVCDAPRDAGHSDVCHICSIPWDAGYFDEASIKPAPQRQGQEVELARYALHPQYCGVLLYFVQYAEPASGGTPGKDVFETPGYEWLLLCNGQPRAPYLPTSLIRNPWGQMSLPIHLRLEEGCTLRLVLRLVSSPPGIVLAKAGGRLMGRYWYNAVYGGAPNRL